MAVAVKVEKDSSSSPEFSTPQKKHVGTDPPSIVTTLPKDLTAIHFPSAQDPMLEPIENVFVPSKPSAKLVQTDTPVFGKDFTVTGAQ